MNDTNNNVTPIHQPEPDGYQPDDRDKQYDVYVRTHQDVQRDAPFWMCGTVWAPDLKSAGQAAKIAAEDFLGPNAIAKLRIARNGEATVMELGQREPVKLPLTPEKVALHVARTLVHVIARSCTDEDEHLRNYERGRLVSMLASDNPEATMTLQTIVVDALQHTEGL